MFHRVDAEAINRIPLSRRHTPDTMFWLHTKNGKFLVKTGYQVARQLKREEHMQGESSLSGVSSSVWTKLMKLHILNKIKVFEWCACHDILPTWENLVCKHVIDDGICGLCTRTTKSALHALWECGVC